MSQKKVGFHKKVNKDFHVLKVSTTLFENVFKIFLKYPNDQQDHPQFLSPTNGPPMSNSTYLQMDTSSSILSTFKPSSPAVLTLAKGLQLVQFSCLIPVTYFPLYVTSKGQGPVDSMCFGNSFFSCHLLFRPCFGCLGC